RPLLPNGRKRLFELLRAAEHDRLDSGARRCAARRICSRNGLEKGSGALASTAIRRVDGIISRINSTHLPASSPPRPPVPPEEPDGQHAGRDVGDQGEGQHFDPRGARDCRRLQGPGGTFSIASAQSLAVLPQVWSAIPRTPANGPSPTAATKRSAKTNESLPRGMLRNHRAG